MAIEAVDLTTPSWSPGCGSSAAGQHQVRGSNHSHITKLLRERKGIDLSRPSVRRILAKAGTVGLLDPHLATLETGEVDWDLRPRKSKAEPQLNPPPVRGLFGKT